MKQITLLSIVGARPQLIKASVLSRKIAEKNTRTEGGVPIADILIHTGQHYDRNMSGIFFQELHMPEPTENLCIGSGRHGEMTGRMLPAIESTILAHKPDMVVLYGDTNSTLAGALAASRLKVPIAHIEAGLRSFNLTMPEEINRVISDHVSDLLFCPTTTSIRNLNNEGIRTGICHAGDIMLDAVRIFRPLALAHDDLFSTLPVRPGQYYLATVHRQENTDDPERLASIWKALHSLSAKLPVIIPLHPRTRQRLASLTRLPESAGIHFIEPASYLNMMRLEMNARAILTDSGGVQKEAFFHGVPCVTLREETEWEETVTAGWNRLAGSDPDTIVAAAVAAQKGRPILDFGDGNAADIILECMINFITGIPHPGHERRCAASVAY